MSNEEIVRRIRAGEDTLIYYLWEENKGLAYSVAKRYRAQAEYNRACSLDDLLQESFPAILEALRAYDATRGAAFSTVFVWYLTKAMRRALGLTGRPRLDAACAPLDVPFPGDPEGPLKVDCLEDPDAPDMDELAILDDSAACVRREVENLPEQERDTIKMRYFQGASYQVIAAALGMESFSHAKSTENRALRKLRMNRRIRELCEFRSYSAPDPANFFINRGLTSFETARESVVEAAALRREKIREFLGQDFLEQPWGAIAPM